VDCRELPVPARLHPARAAAIVAAPRRITMADFIDISRLVDVHHEYPGETFLIVDDTLPANGGIAAEDDILAAVSAYVAFGIVPSKVVIFRHSAVPEAYQLLWRTRALVTPRRRSGRTDGIFTTRALLFAATCLAVRATTMAARDSDAAACRHARTISASFNAGRQESVLAEPTIRPLDVMDDDVDVEAARAFSPFDSRPSIEERLLAIGAFANGRRGQVLQALSRLDASLGGEPSTLRDFTPSSARDDGRAFVQHVAGRIEQWFATIVERRDRLLRRPDDLRGLLREGARLARDEATATLAEMYAI
jgi:hypothetical protein